MMKQTVMYASSREGIRHQAKFDYLTDAKRQAEQDSSSGAAVPLWITMDGYLVREYQRTGKSLLSRAHPRGTRRKRR